MGAMLMPALIGAGVGAVGGAVTGANPLKTALLGAGLGAGGAGLLGAGAAGGAGAATAAGGADLAAGTVAPAILGTPTLNASLLTPGAMAGLGATPSVYGGLGASSLLDKTGAFLSNNIGNPFSNMSTMDKINLGAKGFDALTPPPQQMQQAPIMPIKPGNPDMVSTPLYNVAPSIGRQEGNEIGLPNLMTRMPLTEEELLRLQQQLQTTGYRGR
jgi:hypothetical protein